MKIEHNMYNNIIAYNIQNIHHIITYNNNTFLPVYEQLLKACYYLINGCTKLYKENSKQKIELLNTNSYC